MTPEQINAAIAEACGWYLIKPPEKDGTRAFSIREPVAATLYPWRETPEEAWTDAPDYCNDLNAMHKVELTMTNKQADELFYYWLAWTVSQGKCGNQIWQYRKLMVHATAAQRAEAFLRTVGKWKEGV